MHKIDWDDLIMPEYGSLKKTLTGLYGKYRSWAKVADRLGVDHLTVLARCKKLGIDTSRKTAGLAARLRQIPEDKRMAMKPSELAAAVGCTTTWVCTLKRGGRI